MEEEEVSWCGTKFECKRAVLRWLRLFLKGMNCIRGKKKMNQSGLVFLNGHFSRSFCGRKEDWSRTCIFYILPYLLLLAKFSSQ